jgi:hypothetical protein
MSLEKTVLFAAVCDGCGADWWDGYAETAPMFVSRPAAFRQLRDEYEWSITRQIDGRHNMLCSACSDKQDCQRYGHRWFRASADDPRRLNPALEMCSRCHIIRRDDAPPPGHPDSMTVELGDEIEEWLAALDAELDPDRANEAA